MSAEEFLRLNEKKVLEGEIVSRVKGKKSKKKYKKLGSFSATAFVTLILVVFVVLFSSGNLIPAVIADQLTEETDIQYADAVESKIIVFQQAMVQGDIPSNTAMRLKDAGVLVGRMEDGNFIEGASGKNLVLKMGDKIITADNFVSAVHSDVALYNALNEATYSRASGYYDETAKMVFRKIGTSRNNYTGDDDFDAVMSKMVGEGSAIKVDSVALVEKKNEEGEKYYEYETIGGAVADSGVDDFVEAVANKNTAVSQNKATLNAASALNTADKISQEQKSSLYYLAFMENISKMKAGEGNESKINEAMNYLYEERASKVVDVASGELVTVTGSMLESPSLYAVLSGEKVDTQKATNYSSDRVLKTIENQLGVSSSDGAITGTVTSTTSKIRGTIGRYLESGASTAVTETLSTVTPTVQSSLIDNSFEDIGGVSGGELLVEGAVNVGKALAKASGATAGDAIAAKKYARLNNTVLAMDAKAEQMTKSPFDITSRNTFLGSIVYKMAASLNYKSTISSLLGSLSRAVIGSIAAILPTTHADDENNSYLTNFGECETLESINAVGSATCATVATFDTSTLNDPFNDSGFVNFVEENTELIDGVRVIKKDSVLASFIKYNNERLTPDGIIDGGILSALNNNSSSIPFVSDILAMIKTWLAADEGNKRIASGAAFVNSESNGDWETYKYAQRYVSLARATAALRQYDGDKTAYNNLRFFEGAENPVVAFLNEYYNIASN